MHPGGEKMSRVPIAAVLCSCLALLPPSSAAQPLPPATPESVGLSTERLSRVDALFESYIVHGHLAGVVVAIARQGKLVNFRTMGRQPTR